MASFRGAGTGRPSSSPAAGPAAPSPFPQPRGGALPCAASAGSSAAPRRCDIVPGPAAGTRRGRSGATCDPKVSARSQTPCCPLLLWAWLGAVNKPSMGMPRPKPGHLPDDSRPLGSSSSTISPSRAHWALLHLGCPVSVLGVRGPRILKLTWAQSPESPQSSMGTDPSVGVENWEQEPKQKLLEETVYSGP